MNNVDEFYICKKDNYLFGILRYKKDNVYKLIKSNFPATPYFVSENNIIENVYGIAVHMYCCDLEKFDLAKHRDNIINEILND